MTTPYERIADARSRLVQAGIPEPDAALDAEVLARHALNWDRAALLSRGRDAAPPGFAARFDGFVARRLRREPVAYIVGSREFWGLEFAVTPDVLVPRPETELIVEEAVAFAREHPCSTVVDVGTGSGCVAVAVASELPRVRLIGTDVSSGALSVARGNAARHAVADRVSFIRTDLLNGVGARVDLILSNPPYLRAGDAASLQPEVARYEPATALFAGADGLAVIRRLLLDARSLLAPDGRLMIEFGMGQERDLRRAAEEIGWTTIRVRTDLQGIPRTIVLGLRS